MTKTTTAVLVPCRLGVGARWADACIHEVGSGGIVISTGVPLRVGTHIQVRRGSLTIVGQVHWVRGARIGITTQDQVSADALVAEPRLTRRPASGLSGDRRQAIRAATQSDIAFETERSRRFASALQFAAITLATGGGAYLLASQLYVALSIPFATISAAMGS